MENPPPYQGPSYPQQQPIHPVIIVPGAVQRAPAVVTTVMAGPVGPKPTPMTCRSCGAQIVTRVEYQAATKTHLMAGLLFLFGCWCCCCIPYCMDSCRNAEHYCPNCNSYIGAYIS